MIAMSAVPVVRNVCLPKYDACPLLTVRKDVNVLTLHASAEDEQRPSFYMNKTKVHRWNLLAGEKKCDVRCQCVMCTSDRDRH